MTYTQHWGSNYWIHWSFRWTKKKKKGHHWNLTNYSFDPHFSPPSLLPFPKGKLKFDHTIKQKSTGTYFSENELAQCKIQVNFNTNHFSVHSPNLVQNSTHLIIGYSIASLESHLACVGRFMYIYKAITYILVCLPCFSSSIVKML
jgi:hypothetical protein